MNSLRNKIFACAIFPQNKHRLIVLGKTSAFFLQKAHRGAFPYNRIKRDDVRCLPGIKRRGVGAIMIELINNCLHFMDFVLERGN